MRQRIPLKAYNRIVALSWDDLVLMSNAIVFIHENPERFERLCDHPANARHMEDFHTRITSYLDSIVDNREGQSAE